MKRTDIPWILLFCAIAAFIAAPATRELFIGFTSAYPYVGGFVKFAVLATLGEWLAIRITGGNWTIPKGAVFRMIIWGIIGMALVLVFAVLSAGVASAMEKGLLPGEGSALAFAFLTSSFMNLTFGPVMMIFHRISDTFIDLGYAEKTKVSVQDVVAKVDWKGFYSFVICKTVPLFWIPAHTITFLLSPEYRVLMAACLSLALGLILAFAKKKAAKQILQQEAVS